MTSNTTDHERQPLLSNIPHGSPILAQNTIEFNEQSPTQEPDTTNAQHNENDDEARWFEELQNKPWYNRPSIFWLMPWIFILGVTVSISSSSIEQLKIQVICNQLLGPQDGSNDIPGNIVSVLEHTYTLAPIDRCKTGEVLGFVGQLNGKISAVQGIFTLLTLAKWTSMSDVFGRKFLLHIGIGGICLSFLLNWFAISRFNFLGYYIYFLEAVTLGLVPSGPLINPAIMSYSADCTRKVQRSLMIGYIVTSYALGNMIGSALGGYIFKVTNDLTIVVKFSVISSTLLAIFLAFLPESLKTRPITLRQWLANMARREDYQVTVNIISFKSKEPTAARLKHIYQLIKSSLSSIFDPLLLFVPGHIVKSKNMATSATPTLIVLGSLFVYVALTGPTKLFVPMTNLIFHWTAYEDSLYSLFVFACSTATFLAVFPALQWLYKKVVSDSQQMKSSQPLADSNESIINTSMETEFSNMDAIKMDLFFAASGMSLLVIANFLIPIVATVPILYFTGALKALGGVASIANISILSSIMPGHLIGAALGAMSVSDALGNITSDLAYGYLFSRTWKTSPLLYYYVSAVLCILALLFTLVNWWTYRRK